MYYRNSFYFSLFNNYLCIRKNVFSLVLSLQEGALGLNTDAMIPDLHKDLSFGRSCKY